MKSIKLNGNFEDCTPSNSALIRGFKAVLDNPNASYESRKTAKDYFSSLAELADQAEKKGRK
tara:strand:+ start:426 stop:611 length:186 start_codon:yes stop_codon:yes gene_type:complete